MQQWERSARIARRSEIDISLGDRRLRGRGGAAALVRVVDVRHEIEIAAAAREADAAFLGDWLLQELHGFILVRCAVVRVRV